MQTDFVEVSRQDMQLINSDDDSDEPQLQYCRLSSSIHEILEFQKCTAFATAPRFLALGTDAGSVHLLDFHGNEIRRFQNHISTVNDIVFDTTFEYMASCGSDGSVTVLCLYEDEGQSASRILTTAKAHLSPPLVQLLYDSAVTSVSLDPRYASAFHKNVCVGCLDGQLFVNTPGWLRGRKDNVLHSNQGPVAAVRWCGNYVAWANDKGIKIFNYATGQRLGFVRLAFDESMRSCRCHLRWETNLNLVIAWGRKVKIVSVQEKSETSGARQEHVILANSFTTDFLISGITTTTDFLVLLAFDETQSKVIEGKKIRPRPELRIVSRNCQEFVADALSIVGYEDLGPHDYILEGMIDGTCFISTPKEVISVDLRPWFAWACHKLVSHELHPQGQQPTQTLRSRIGEAEVVKAVIRESLHSTLADPLLSEWLGGLGQGFWHDCASSEEKIRATVDFACHHLHRLAGDLVPAASPQAPLKGDLVLTEKVLVVLKYHTLQALSRRQVNERHTDDLLRLLDHCRLVMTCVEGQGKDTSSV